MGPIERLAILRAHAAALNAAIEEHGVITKGGPDGTRLFSNPAMNALVNVTREIRALEPVAAEEQKELDALADAERRRIAEEERARARLAEEQARTSSMPRAVPSIVHGGRVAS